MAKSNIRAAGRMRRKMRIRKNIAGTAERPRLSVFRSTNHTYAQLIDDETGTTLVAASTHKLDLDGHSGNIEAAKAVGAALAEAAKAKNVSSCVFDRNGYRYHGRVKALADAAREGGLAF